MLAYLTPLIRAYNPCYTHIPARQVTRLVRPLTLSQKVKFQEIACFRMGGEDYAGNNFNHI